MWRIGDLSIPGPVVLGPMSGYTFDSYRRFMEPFGADVLVTEMTSCMGIVYGQERTEGYLDFEPTGITGVQLFGCKPDAMAKAAVMTLESNPEIRFFDINMGCPVPKVVRNGSGSALMRDPKKCGEIVKAMTAAVDVPITVKMRLGQSSEELNFRDVMDETISAGADAVTIHARTRRERYTGRPHWDMLEGIRREMSVPLVVSGNIYTAEDASHAMDITGAEGIMVARGGVGNPFLLTQIQHMSRGGPIPPNPTLREQTAWCRELTDMVIEDKGFDQGIAKMRSIAPKFISGVQDCREYRRRIAREMKDRESLFRILDDVDADMGDVRIMSYGVTDDADTDL
ncbi:MAG: tRNA dihydrouridine synthase [Candidatus Methanomethylophilaceae archaeon]